MVLYLVGDLIQNIGKDVGAQQEMINTSRWNFPTAELRYSIRKGYTICLISEKPNSHWAFRCSQT